jgi:hypothetical protein
VEAIPRSAAAERVLLAASIIAAEISQGHTPAGKDLFLLSAAVVEGGNAGDLDALETSIESIKVLIQQILYGGIWEGCRGHLDATMQFAWLLRRAASKTTSPVT